MATLEFWARIKPDRTLDVPPDVADQLHADEPVRVIVIVPNGDEPSWSDLTTDQFLRGYNAGDAIYDDVASQ